MLFSRAIDLREVGQLALVPYADLLNHSPYASSYFFYNSIPLSKKREVTLYADRNYAKNDQVLISCTLPRRRTRSKAAHLRSTYRRGHVVAGDSVRIASKGLH